MWEGERRSLRVRNRPSWPTLVEQVLVPCYYMWCQAKARGLTSQASRTEAKGTRSVIVVVQQPNKGMGHTRVLWALSRPAALGSKPASRPSHASLPMWEYLCVVCAHDCVWYRMWGISKRGRTTTTQDKAKTRHASEIEDEASRQMTRKMPPGSLL